MAEDLATRTQLSDKIKAAISPVLCKERASQYFRFYGSRGLCHKCPICPRSVRTQPQALRTHRTRLCAKTLHLQKRLRLHSAVAVVPANADWTGSPDQVKGTLWGSGAAGPGGVLKQALSSVVCRPVHPQASPETSLVSVCTADEWEQHPFSRQL